MFLRLTPGSLGYIAELGDNILQTIRQGDGIRNFNLI